MFKYLTPNSILVMCAMTMITAICCFWLIEDNRKDFELNTYPIAFEVIHDSSIQSTSAEGF